MKTPTNNTNNEINTIVALASARYTEVLLNNTTDELILQLQEGKHKLPSVAQYIAIIEDLKSNANAYTKLVEYAIKLVITSNIKQVPLTVLNNQVAETMLNHTPTSRLRIATTIVRLLQLSELFTIGETVTSEGYMERIVLCTYTITSSTKEELSTKIWNVPKEVHTVANSARVAGHRKKLSKPNHDLEYILQKLNNVGYNLDERVWNKFKHKLASYRFVQMNVQDNMIEIGDNLLGKTFYFNHKFGPDNGRIYCEGDLFTLQGGALNHCFKFADKRILSKEGMQVLQERVDELASESSLSFKEQVEFYSLSVDLIDAQHGKPVGTILHIDAKLSGLQHQTIAIRDHQPAKYCGLLDEVEDGYNRIRAMLSNADALTRDMVKKAYNPYQYGAGEKATMSEPLKLGANIDFVEWEAAYAKAYPNIFRLREFLLELARYYNRETFEFTTPSGYEAVITALGTKDDVIDTIYGKLTYERQEIDKDFMGVKIVAAFSHMMDSSLVHYVTSKVNYDLHVVHDSFGQHPNDVANTHQLYIDGMRENLTKPILLDFVSSVVGKDRAEVNVERLIQNTLKPSDIVGGLF